MGLKIEFKTEGVEEFRKVIRKINPEKNPKVIRKAMLETGRLLQRTVKEKYLRGPRPRRLDRVTGELSRSIVRDERKLEEFVGVGTELFWAEFHEVGLGRFRKRPFIEPAVDDVMDKLPGIFLEAWEESLRR